MKKNILMLENMVFKFDQVSPYFFNGVSLSFMQGTINFIQGRNGSGKTTLFRILQNDIHEHEHIQGHIIINEKKYQLGKQPCNDIGLVQQQTKTMIADQFTFKHNIQLAAMAQYPRLKKLQAIQQLPSFVEQFCIDYKKPGYLLSGGQQQILVILMMLQKRKKILLLDEPTAALDKKNAQFVFDFLQEIATKTETIVVVICHDTALVKKYAQNKYFEILKDQYSELRTIQKIRR